MTRSFGTTKPADAPSDLADSHVIAQDGVLPKKGNAVTGALAAGIRVLSAQFVAFYFRVPMKAFFRTKVDYMGMSLDVINFHQMLYFAHQGCRLHLFLCCLMLI